MAVDTREAQLLPEVQSFLAEPKRLLIGDEWVEPASGRTFATIDPATERELAQVALGGAEDVDRAVAAARAAFGSWGQTRPYDRSAILLKIADLIEQNVQALAQVESLDSGKPVSFAGAEMIFSARTFRYYAGWCDKVYGETNPTGADQFVFTLREPVGVCGQIIPWNFPMLMAAWKIAPAIAFGNTVVLKPAEETPLTALWLAKICLEAGVPAGVVNIVTGDGESTGAPLAAHPGLDKIAFTGSTEVGKLIMKSAADNLTPLSLELGGKSPNVIFADADLGQAVANAMMGVFYNSGQICTAGSRLLVQREVHDEVVEQLTATAGAWKVGDGLEPGTMVGPLVNKAQHDRVTGYQRIGAEEGATVALGGGAPDGPGFFVEPTIFTGVRPDMRIAREEIFGPVLSVIPFDDADDAVRLANDTIYGLAAAVWTSDVKKAHRMARAIKSGTVWVNSYMLAEPPVSFGGYKSSGFGRELGKHSVDLYTSVKSVWMQL